MKKLLNAVRSLGIAFMAVPLIIACGGGDNYDGDGTNTEDVKSTETSILEADVTEQKLPLVCMEHTIQKGDSCVPIADDPPDATSTEEELTDEVTSDPCAPAQIASGNWQKKDDDTIVTFSPFVENPHDNSLCYTKTENFGVGLSVKKGEWTVFVGPSFDNPKISGTVNDDEFVFEGPLTGGTPLVLVRP